MSDYLWDKEGKADPELAHLEQVLSPLAYGGRPPTLPGPRRRRGVWIGVGAAACLVVILILARRPHEVVRPGFAMSVSGGIAKVDDHAAGPTLPVGAWLETGPSHVELRVASIGVVDLAPSTRARIVTTSEGLHEMELDHGTLSARIEAKPRAFAVSTKHARVVDLGCAFTIEVDAAGLGHVVVTAGSVAASVDGGREVTVPAGAESALGEHGASASYASDATPAFRLAIARFATDPSALPALLKEARPKDGFTLRALAVAGSPEEKVLLARASQLESTPPVVPHATPLKVTKPKPKRPTLAPKQLQNLPTHVPIAPGVAKPTVAPKSTDPRLRHDSFNDVENSVK